MLAEATETARRQMAADIYTIEMANEQARDDNASIIPVLKSAAGAPASLGDDEDAWRVWWFDTLGYSYQASPKPTFTAGCRSRSILPYSIRTCFAAGTPVHTLDGARPIEAIQVGDQVFSQDAATGALSFQPVVFVHRNPPAKTLRIRLSDGESVVCSVYHRFWRANLGWAQARELKPGDTLRHLGGIVRVDSIGPDSVQPSITSTSPAPGPSSSARVNSWSTTIRSPTTGSCHSTRCPSGSRSDPSRTLNRTPPRVE